MSTRTEESSRKSGGPLVYLLILTLYLFSNACAGSTHTGNDVARVAESASTPAPTTPESNAAPSAAANTPAPAETSAPPPKPEEVRAAVARIYRDAVVIETGHQPVVGDFNGDGSQDIAVALSPLKSKLKELNDEYANWIIENPRLTQAGAPVKVQPNDALLAIIHGYQTEGWRNPKAMQTYLLRDALGTLMTATPVKDLMSATAEQNRLLKSGDVITEVLAGESGFLYWTGAKYAWHKE
ncbi:MAG TPA: FG-GAP repeat protein [Pyrinomonadaceae bacterium]